MSDKCASCKNKQSKDRCPNSAIKGLKFCGIHSRIKSPRMWIDVNDVQSKVTIISKVWKGYSIRKNLKLAGEGVLKRGICNNTCEIVSLEDISTVDPLD